VRTRTRYMPGAPYHSARCAGAAISKRVIAPKSFMTSISYVCAPATSENSMSSRVASDPVSTCGASDGQEIPLGLIGGNSARGPFELDAFADTDAPDSDAPLCARRGEPTRVTEST